MVPILEIQLLKQLAGVSKDLQKGEGLDALHFNSRTENLAANLENKGKGGERPISQRWGTVVGEDGRGTRRE